jgi:NTE family protein
MIKNIVFGGGGFKGWAYIGTIRALGEYINFSQIENIAGTSIGSIYALFYILRIPWGVLLEYALNMKIKNMIDINTIHNLYSKKSLIKGEKFKEYNISIIKDYINPEITFGEFKKIYNIKLSIICTNVTKKQMEVFNYETTPHVKLIDAVVASCSLPFVFPFHKIQDDYYCDGGVFNNFPTDLFEDIFTIGFCSSSFDLSYCDQENSSDDNNNDDNNNNLLNFFSMFMNIKKEKEKNINEYYILNKDYDNEFLNINQTRDDIFTIYMTGYEKSRQIIFDNYIALK